MKNYELLREECLNEVRNAGIEPGNIVRWTINKRAKKRWGQCRKYPNGECEIEISSWVLEDERIPVEICKNTLIHEILHSCPECMGHTGMWKVYAKRMKDIYGYEITRTANRTDFGIEEYEVQSRPVKYVYRCKGCGQVITRTRSCKFTKYYRRYGCGLCGRKYAFEKVG